MKLFLLAVAVTAVNVTISTAITVIAFKKMYSIYYERTMDLYEKMGKLADTCVKK